MSKADGLLDLYFGMTEHEPFIVKDASVQWPRMQGTMSTEGWNDMCEELVRIGNCAATQLLSPEMGKTERYMDEAFLQGELSAVRKFFGFLHSVEKNVNMEQEGTYAAKRSRI